MKGSKTIFVQFKVWTDIHEQIKEMELFKYEGRKLFSR